MAKNSSKTVTGRVLHDPVKDKLRPMYPLDLSKIKTIDDLVRAMGDTAYTKRLRVAGNVVPGTIHQVGTNADFILVEQDPQTKQRQELRVSYKGTEPPPDTFKDNAQALVMGEFGKDQVFHAREIQAKCASKYAPQQGGADASSASSSKGY